MPRMRENDLLLRLIKDINDVRANLRRIVGTVNLPLYDIANENTPTTLSADQNNFVPGNYDNLRLSSNKTVTITGISGGVKGRQLKLFNVGTNAILLDYQSTDSLAANRFKFQTGRLAYLGPGDIIALYYDDVLSRWISAVTVFDSMPFWIRRDVPTGTFLDVVYAEELGLFVAVGQGGTNYVMTSPDGNTWTARAAAENNIWLSIDWSPELSLLVAVSSNGTNQVMTSPDGITWTARVEAAANFWGGVAWSPELGLFAAVSYSGTGNRVMTSPDGITWTSRVSAADYQWRDVAWSPELGLFAACADSGAQRIMTSPDGITWTLRTFASGASDIIWDKFTQRFYTYNAFSPDGITWTLSTVAGGSPMVFDVARGRLFSVGSPTNATFFSEDGVIWTPGPDLPTTGFLTIGYSVPLNKFVVLGISVLATSP